MPPDAFAAEVDRLWEQVQPLYDVAARLRARASCARSTAPTWCRRRARSPRTCSATCGRRSGATSTRWWRRQDADPGFDLTEHPARRRTSTRRRWCATASASSPRSASRRCPRPSGSARCSPSRATARWSATPAPGTSTTTTTCASRCASRSTSEDFITIHHELGHNFYQRAYNKQPFLFRDSANDGFHEAIGDTIALSVTPELPEAGRPARQGARRLEATSACCCRRRSTRSPSCPSAC